MAEICDIPFVKGDTSGSPLPLFEDFQLSITEDALFWNGMRYPLAHVVAVALNEGQAPSKWLMVTIVGLAAGAVVLVHSAVSALVPFMLISGFLLLAACLAQSDSYTVTIQLRGNGPLSMEFSRKELAERIFTLLRDSVNAPGQILRGKRAA